MVKDNPQEYRNEGKFGTIPGIEVGATWRTREECAKARVHNSTTAGISGGKDGACSIVMSGGYDDDEDKGNEIIYTGTGGYEDKRYGGGSSRSWGGGTQVAHQTPDHPHNKALLISCELSKPVRVIRGHGLNSKYAPHDGYRYDGLYMVKSVITPFLLYLIKLSLTPRVGRDGKIQGRLGYLPLHIEGARPALLLG